MTHRLTTIPAGNVIIALLLAAALVTGCGPQVTIIEVTATPMPTLPPTATAGPTTVTVCASGCDFATIQAAVDDVGVISGSTIEIADAVHTETSITIGKDVIIQGQRADSTIIQAHEKAGEATDRVFFIEEGAVVTIQGVTIQYGNPDLEPLIPGIRRSGGGIVNQGALTLTNVVVRDNVASAGGGIYNMGPLTITNSTISHNFADGIDKPGQGCGSGGGIMHLREGSVLVVNSTISGNRGTGKGGGIKSSCAAPMTLVNSTVSGNSTTSNGGGIYARSTLNLIHCTINGNNASGGDVSGVYVQGTLNFTNTIIANSIVGLDCAIGSSDRSSGAIGVNTNNLIGDNTCDPNYSGDPTLGNLADNGGSTQAHALLPGSPAIDAAECTLATDQRGKSRPQGTTCDLGAFEVQSDE